jgi:hypothetical protein
MNDIIFRMYLRQISYLYMITMFNEVQLIGRIPQIKKAQQNRIELVLHVNTSGSNNSHTALSNRQMYRWILV